MRLQFENFGRGKICRPSIQAEIQLRQRREQHLRSEFDTRIYTSRDEINSILQHEYSFFEEVMDGAIGVLASRDLLEFVFHQYDQSVFVEDDRKKGALTTSELERWQHIGPVFRRALKFIAERVAMSEPEGPLDLRGSQIDSVTQRLLIAAEMAAGMYLLSDHTYHVFPDSTVLEILPPGMGDLTDFRLETEYNMVERIETDREHHEKFLGEDAQNPIHDLPLREKHLDEGMREAVGIGYRDAFSVIVTTIENTDPVKDSFPTYFLRKAGLTESLSDFLELPKESIDKVLDGFLLTAESMQDEGRLFFESRQEYRAFYRGFFLIPHQTGPHVAFSKEMAKENLQNVFRGMTFKRLPPEWQNDKLTQGLEKLSEVASDWFEEAASDSIEELGFKGVRNAMSLGREKHNIEIPEENVGEIDYLGYHESEDLLLVAEHKLVNPTYEGKGFRQDIAKFTRGDSSYVEKVRRKAKWVRDNLQEVAAALESTKMYDHPVAPQKTAVLICTRYPSVVDYLVEDMPCVSLANFMLAFRKDGSWPYSKGMRPAS